MIISQEKRRKYRNIRIRCCIFFNQIQEPLIFLIMAVMFLILQRNDILEYLKAIIINSGNADFINWNIVFAITNFMLIFATIISILQVILSIIRLLIEKR